MAQACLKKKKGNRNWLFITLMMAFPVAQWLVFFVYVNISTIQMSFQYLNITTFEVEYSLFNYRTFVYELFNMKAMGIAVKNSLLAMVNNIFVLLPLSILCGYFYYKKVFLAGAFKVIFFLPNIISIIVMTMVFKFMFDPSLGLIPEVMKSAGFEEIPDFFNDPKYAFPLILLYCNWVGVGYNTLILSGNINKLPKELLEVGQLEGIGMMRELWTIIVPCIWDMVSTMIVTGSMVIFTFFIQVQILTNGNADSQTLAYIINGYVAGADKKMEKGAAFGICLTIIAAPFLLLMKRLTGHFFKDIEF